MKVDLQQAAESIRGYLQQTGKNLATQDSALAESQKAVNQIVKMAKLGGMTGDDAQTYTRYAAAASNASGLSAESMMAIGALAKRGGLRGDEAGTFMRTVAAKLVAPGNPGLTALSAAGLNYGSYVQMPQQLDANRLNMQLQNRLGISMNKSTQDRVQTMLKDKDVLKSQGEFTQRLLGALESGGLVGKGGGAASKAKVASALGSFYAASAEKVDAQRLLNDIMGNEKISLAQLNMLLGYRMGGRGAITTRQRSEYIAAQTELSKAGDDPDFAKRKADEVLAGVGGAMINAKGSVENFTLAVGEANSGLIKWTADMVGKGLDAGSNLPQPALQGLSLTAGAMGLGAGAYGLVKLMGGFGLSASAVALDASAAALMSAATALGATNAVKTAATTAVPAAAVAATPWLARAIPFLKLGARFGGPAVTAALGGYEMYQATQQYEGMTSGERMKRQRGGSMNDIMRNAFNEERERLGISAIGTPSKTEVTGTMKGEAKITIDIPGLPSRTVNVPMDGTISANGPGSLGVSSPDAAAPNHRGPR